MKHTQDYFSDDPKLVGFNHKKRMNDPKIVFQVYGIANPIRFSPKIRPIPDKKNKARITIKIAATKITE